MSFFDGKSEIRAENCSSSPSMEIGAGAASLPPDFGSMLSESPGYPRRPTDPPVGSPGPGDSPHGARSPGSGRPDTSGTLRTTIQLGKSGASIVHTGPFYLIKEPVVENSITGATNLMSYHNLEHSYNKFNGKKVKDSLSSFLTNLPGVIDTPGTQDNSSLRSLIEKPPVLGKELLPLTSMQLNGFRLHAGPLPEQFRFLSQAPAKRKHKTKRHRHRIGAGGPGGENSSQDGTESAEPPEKKHKKRRSDDDNQRRKKKKEKKKKKRHSPEHPGSTGTPTTVIKLS